MPRRTATIRVSLFPFLAVLLCAMGALIVLLVILTHEIRENALRSAQSSPPQAESPPPSPSPRPKIIRPAPPVVAPIDPNPEFQATLTKLENQRDTLQQQLDSRKSQLAEARSRHEELERKIQSAQLARDADQRRLAARKAELDQQRADVQSLQERLEKAEADLEDAEQKFASAAPKLQIVPYDGRSGTARKPILIECTADAIRFVPEDVSLSAAQIEGFRPDFNPLLAGAAALRNYGALQDDNDNSRPYILLVVREDGIIAYYAARSLLESLGADTGYELIATDQQIAYPELDPQAREVCQKAVRQALQLRPSLGADSDETTFRNGRFDVDPREHDPTRRGTKDDDSLYPVRKPSRSRGNADEPARPSDKFSNGNLTQNRTDRSKSDPSREDDFPSRIGDSIRRESPSPSGRSSPDESNRYRAPRKFEPSEKPSTPPFPLESLEDQGSAHSSSSGRTSQSGPPPEEKQWGSSEPGATISLEHTLRIRVTANEIQIADQPALLVGPAGLTKPIIQDVFSAIDQEADQWKQAPSSFYWTPHVKAAVAPGGQFLFTRLRAKLRAAGLRVTDHLELDAPSPRAMEWNHAAPSP